MCVKWEMWRGLARWNIYNLYFVQGQSWKHLRKVFQNVISFDFLIKSYNIYIYVYAPASEPAVSTDVQQFFYVIEIIISLNSNTVCDFNPTGRTSAPLWRREASSFVGSDRKDPGFPDGNATGALGISLGWCVKQWCLRTEPVVDVHHSLSLLVYFCISFLMYSARCLLYFIVYLDVNVDMLTYKCSCSNAVYLPFVAEFLWWM